MNLPVFFNTRFQLINDIDSGFWSKVEYVMTNVIQSVSTTLETGDVCKVLKDTRRSLTRPQHNAYNQGFHYLVEPLKNVFS